MEVLRENMKGRTIFLDVVDPSMPVEAQERLHAQLDELAAFKELQPSPWKRFKSHFFSRTIVTEPLPSTPALDALSTACSIVEVCAIGVGCCVCA